MRDLQERWGYIDTTFFFLSGFQNCTQHLFIDYYIGGHKFTLEYKDFGASLGGDYSDSCAMLLQAPGIAEPYNDSITWTLALPFFKRYCHVYDYEKNLMGLAEALIS
jgi:hypothetical protein